MTAPLRCADGLNLAGESRRGRLDVGVVTGQRKGARYQVVED
jgi:hypothetical protein